MREIEDLLRSIEQLDGSDEDGLRSQLNAEIRAAFRAAPDAARAFLETKDICIPEQALAASAL